jgi:hypothetical protein
MPLTFLYGICSHIRPAISQEVQNTDPPPPQDPGYSACYNLLHARIKDCTLYCCIALLLASFKQLCTESNSNFVFVFQNKSERN